MQLSFEPYNRIWEIRKDNDVRINSFHESEGGEAYKAFEYIIRFASSAINVWESLGSEISADTVMFFLSQLPAKFLERFYNLSRENKIRVLYAFVKNKNRFFDETLDFIKLDGDMSKSTISNITKDLL